MLSVLQEKLGEAHGLAMAAEAVLERVEERVADAELRRALDAMRQDGEETRARCLLLERRLGDEARAEILAHANSTRELSTVLVGAWFKAGTGPLAAWSFLTMTEAGELAVWTALASLAGRAGGETGAAAADLAAWALPVHERHLRVSLEGAVRLAELTDPAADRWG